MSTISLIEMIIGQHYGGEGRKECAAQIVRQLRASGISLVSTAIYEQAKKELKEFHNDRRTSK